MRLARVPAAAFVAAALGLVAAPRAHAQDRPKPGAAKPEPAKRRGAGPAAKGARNKGTKRPPREQVFDFTGLELQGSMRTPQLLYFLNRASQELDRASLERRSFVPELVRSLDEEGL